MGFKDIGGPEERLLPRFSKSAAADEKWIDSQVFTSKKDKKLRFYYAALVPVGAGEIGAADVYKCVYKANARDADTVELSSYNVGWSFAGVIQTIANAERIMLESADCEPVPGLRGNYREVAKSQGIYLDDDGNVLTVNKDTRVAANAIFDRQGLNKIYGDKPQEQPAVPVVATWEDFYRDVVNNPDRIRFPGTPLFSPKATNALLGGVKELQQTITTDWRSRSEKRQAILDLSRISCPDYYPDLLYHFNVVVLTSLMRAGTDLYRQFSSSAVLLQKDAVQSLSDVGSAINTFAQQRFGLSPERAQKIADIIMQGPDPYADKPLPLQAWIVQQQALTPPPAVPRKKMPPKKGYSP